MSWYLSFKRKNHPQTRMKLICFPYAGGSPSAYAPWTKELGPLGVEVISAFLPGRASRYKEEPISNWNSLLGPLYENLKGQMVGDFVLFGHSLGASILYEICLKIKKEGGQMPKSVFVACREGPTVEERSDPISHLDRDTFLAKVAAYGSNVDLRTFPKDFQDVMIKPLRADMRLVETYVQSKDSQKLGIPFTAYYGNEDSLVNREHVRRWVEILENEDNFEFISFEGGHFDVLKSDTIIKDLKTKIPL